MTDNEIIKALECCFTNDWNRTKCDKCKFYTGTLGCVEDLKCASIDLINRQKAEIERLQKYNTEVAYKHYNDGIKEFVERLKEKAYPFPCATGVEYAVTIRAINDAVKEMVSDTE